VTIGGPESVKDFGPVSIDLVGILDTDLAMRRPGLSSLERSLAIWMEGAAWAWPKGRVIVQTNQGSNPVIQALVAGNPSRFHRFERERRDLAGFPVGFPVFRVVGSGELVTAIERVGCRTLLTTTSAAGETICLVALLPERVFAFGAAMRDVARKGVTVRVEAEPHL
jgi:hypothetical protein